MSTIRRPNLDRLRASVAEMEGSESEEEEKDATKKGVKRKRAPRPKGPCEHGVKYRSTCKVCSACPHGKRRSRCKVRRVCNLRAARCAFILQQECGGSQICVHGPRLSARSAAGLSTVVSAARSTIVYAYALSARSAVGHQSDDAVSFWPERVDLPKSALT